MGLLDDAIREHLDLKRRRGADPSEVERAEREALGPVRRAPEELEHPELAPDADEYGYEAESESGESYAEEVGPLAPPPEADFAPPPVSDPGPPTEEHFPESEPAEPEPQPHGTEPLDQDEQQLHEAPPSRAVGEAAAPHAPPDATSTERGPVGDETVEYEIEERHQIGEQPDAEDMLEETPDFLQDTPEHDRLWFEQRPPRDFDFDP